MEVCNQLVHWGGGFPMEQLFGLGVANILGSAFSAYPSTGSFSRSAVMNETGAKTGLAGLVMGLVLCSALQFLTPLFADIPQVRSIFPSCFL
jgi:sulfate transporter 4